MPRSFRSSRLSSGCTITSLVVLSTETSIDFYDLLMTSSLSSGDFSTSFSSTCGTSVWRNRCSFQPAVTLSQLEQICHHFYQLCNTSFSNLSTRSGFLDSRVLPSPLLEIVDHIFACCWHCSFMGSGVPSLAVLLLLGSLGPVLGCFFFLHVHLARVSSNLLLVRWLFIVASGESSAHLLADSFSACFAPRRWSLFRASSTRC